MQRDSIQRRFLFGVLLGAGVGFAAATLLVPQLRTRLRAALIEGVRVGLDRVSYLARDPSLRQERRTEREGRVLAKRIVRMRSAGF